MYARQHLTSTYHTAKSSGTRAEKIDYRYHIDYRPILGHKFSPKNVLSANRRNRWPPRNRRRPRNCIRSAAFGIFNAKPLLLRLFWDVSHLWVTFRCEVMSDVKKKIQPSLTTSALWSRTSVSSMTMSRGDIKLYCSRFQIICFRLIKVVKDRIRTVHQEDRLQNLIVCVAAVVDSTAAADFADFSPNFKCV